MDMMKSNRAQRTYHLARQRASLVFDFTTRLPLDFVRDHKQKPSNSSVSLTSKQGCTRPSGKAGAVPVGRCLMLAGQRVPVLKFAFLDSRPPVLPSDSRPLIGCVVIKGAADSVVKSGLDWVVG